jgi:hypothetical protein
VKWVSLIGWMICSDSSATCAPDRLTPRNPLPEGLKDGILLEAIRFGGGNWRSCRLASQHRIPPARRPPSFVPKVDWVALGPLQDRMACVVNISGEIHYRS